MSTIEYYCIIQGGDQEHPFLIHEANDLGHASCTFNSIIMVFYRFDRNIARSHGQH